MAGRVVRCGLFLALCMLGLAATAHAQAYKWQDEEGRLHFTDDPSDIPARFRKQVQQLDLPEPTYTPQAQGAPQASGADGEFARGVAEGLRVSMPDLPASKRQALAAAIVDRLPLVVVALLLHFAATLAMFGHAVANKRILWAAGNFLVSFCPPLYALIALETDALKKVLIVVAWATGPVAVFALLSAIAGIAA
jgi:hypothetical protein